MECGRGPGDARTRGLDLCAAARTSPLHGVHGGKNAGRACWVVAGTACGGEVSGTYADKFRTCQVCPFYLHVKKEEHSGFKLSGGLVELLHNED